MPLFFQHEVDNDTRLAVWHITEGEAFFDVPLQRAITHPHKRLQHRAGRYLLRHLFADFPLGLILVADTRKPYLEGEAFHFSVSHCGDYAAAIASRMRRVGIDIELPSDKAQRIRSKFISAAEEVCLDALPANEVSKIESATLVWSAKEAAFKWYGRGQVDFRNDMPLRSVAATAAGRFLTHLHFGKEVGTEVPVHSYLLPPLVLSFIASG